MNTSVPTPEHPCVHTEGSSRCTSYRAGHNVHYIQSRLAHEHQDRWVRVDLSEPRGNTVRATFPDGTAHTWWSHDPDALERFHALAVGGTVAYDPGTSLASVASTPGRRALLFPAELSVELSGE